MHRHPQCWLDVQVVVDTTKRLVEDVVSQSRTTHTHGAPTGSGYSAAEIPRRHRKRIRTAPVRHVSTYANAEYRCKHRTWEKAKLQRMSPQEHVAYRKRRREQYDRCIAKKSEEERGLRIA